MPNEFVEPSRSNTRIWFLLAFQAGAVNAGGFLACNRFVTHTTGFATHFAFELANGHEGVALGMLSVPIFFLIGSMITSCFVDLQLSRGRPANYSFPTFLIFLCISTALLLGKLGLFGLFGDQMVFRQDYFLLVLLCLASGLQNALITNASGTAVRTTHLTGITTELGAGLVRSFLGSRDPNPGRRQKEREATRARAGIIIFFILGSATSAYLYLRAQYLGFLVPVFTSLFLLATFIRRTHKKETPMRTLALVLFALTSLSAQAAPEVPPPAAGHYPFANSFQVTMKLHYEVAYAFTQEGQALLEKLRKEGYECWNKGRQTYLCKAFQTTEGAAELIKGRVSRELDGQELVLGDRTGEPSLISKGDDVAEYEVPQSATYGGKMYPSYRLVMTQGNWSVRLGNPTETQFSLSNGKLTLQTQVSVTDSKTAYSIYVVEADFSPAF